MLIQVMTFFSEYHEIGCYIKNQLTDTETGQIESFASDLDECMSICASLPQFDVALYKVKLSEAYFIHMLSLKVLNIDYLW